MVELSGKSLKMEFSENFLHLSLGNSLIMICESMLSVCHDGLLFLIGQ